MKMAMLLAALLVYQCCVGGITARLTRIDDCGTSCSQGLRCKTKPQLLFPPPCKLPAQGLGPSSSSSSSSSSSPVFANVSVATVMRCEGRQKCSLHLRVGADLQLAAAVQGVTICSTSAGMMASCRTLSFTKASRQRMSGMKVSVMNDCTQVSPGQRLEITVRTVPSYCGLSWSGAYVAPGCTSEDLKQHVPDCITGRLSYDVDLERRRLAVSVSDMLEDHDYHLRLCHKGFICSGTGAQTLIRKEEPDKRALLHFSRPLPCLCIEGWSAVADARRVQVCPFKDRVEELWAGISVEALEGRLRWEPACPVAATVALCQRREDSCVDLPGSAQSVSRRQITFDKVDQDPRLCMKFTADSQSWVRCPFANFPLRAWEVVSGDGSRDVRLLTPVNASFSVELCPRGGGAASCRTAETNTFRAVKNKVSINLPGELCNFCLQMKRVDVQFAVTDTYCEDQCNKTRSPVPVISPQPPLDLTWVFVPTVVPLCTVVLLTLALFVYHRRKQKRNTDYVPEQQKDSTFDCVIPALQDKPVCIPDSPQSEKVNLISR